jgi:hypothetical protein
MVLIFGFVLGALLGAWQAHKKGGNLPDKLQYGAVYGIIFVLVLLVLSVVVGWLGVA